MNDFVLRRIALAIFLASTIATWANAESWNQFRGASGDGISTTTVPAVFDEAKNVRWKIAIADEGWSSPVVWDNEIWLTTGSDEKNELRALCVDLQSGKVTKNIKVFDMMKRKVDPAYKADSPHLNSPATPTPVVEEDRVYVSFGSQGLACLDRETGDVVWERRDLRIYQPVRQGSSPIVDEENLYVAFDGNDQQFFIALDKDNGETRWKMDRNVDTDWKATLRSRGFEPKNSGGKPNDNKKSFATATLIEVDGQRQLIAPAAEATIAYAPETGEELWRVLHPGGFNVAARPIYANGLVYVFTSGLNHHLMAIKPDGQGDVTDTHIAWSTSKSTPSIPSPVIVDDVLYMVTDKGGIARCLYATSGEEHWKKRLGGDHWASPVFAAGKLYFSSKQGDITVLQATPNGPEIVARNELNGRFIASPAVAKNSLILRSTTHLYCVTAGYQRSDAELAKEQKEAKSNDADTKLAAAKDGSVDWDIAYAKLLEKSPEIREKVESGGATKEDVIAWMKANFGKNAKDKNAKGNSGRWKGKVAGKSGKKPGQANFYAIVIGRLRSKDIELGEFTMDVDHVSSMYGNRWVKDEIVGKRVRVTGVSGGFLDNLLQIKRGSTLKVRSSSYNSKTKTIQFGHKFHVLERTAPFKPEDFGVPPDEFRGFRGELTGKVIEAEGFEMLVQVHGVETDEQSKASVPKTIQNRRIRIVGFHRQHGDTFADFHEGDLIRVSVNHANPEHDEVQASDVLVKIEK